MKYGRRVRPSGGVSALGLNAGPARHAPPSPQVVAAGAENGRRSHPAGDGGVRSFGKDAEAGRACVGVHSKAIPSVARQGMRGQAGGMHGKRPKSLAA